MVDLWLQQGSGRGLETCSNRNEGTLGRQHQLKEKDAFCARGLWSAHCGGGWIDAARAGGQLTGRRQGVTAGLKTGLAVFTFLARIGHVNGYESSRQKWLQRE